MGNMKHAYFLSQIETQNILSVLEGLKQTYDAMFETKARYFKATGRIDEEVEEVLESIVSLIYSIKGYRKDTESFVITEDMSRISVQQRVMSAAKAYKDRQEWHSDNLYCIPTTLAPHSMKYVRGNVELERRLSDMGLMLKTSSTHQGSPVYDGVVITFEEIETVTE